MSPTVTAPLKASRLLSAGALTLSALLLLPASAVGQDDQGQAPQPGIQAPGAQPQPEGETRAPAYIAAVDGLARLDREGQSEAAERGVPLVPGDRLRTEGGRVELAFPNGTPGLSRSLHRGRARGSAGPARRARPPLRARLVDHRRRRARHDRRPWRHGSISRTTASTASPSAAPTPWRSSSSSSAVRRRCRARAATCWCRRATARWRATARRRRRRNGPTPARPRSSAGPPTGKRCGRAASTPRGSTCRPSSATTPPPSTSTAPGRTTRPTAPSGIRAAPPRIGGRTTTAAGTTRRRYGWTWIAGGAVWAYPTHHYGRWNLGARGWHWIPSRRWGAAWVVLGGRAGLRRLVPARLERPPGAQRVPLRPQLSVALARSVPRLDGDPAHVVRTRARAGRPRRSRPARSRAAGVRPAASLARLRAAAIAVSVALQPAPQRRDQRHRSRAGARRRLDDEPAQLRPLRQRPRQPRRPRRPARHRVRRGHDDRVAV